MASCADTWDRVYEGGNPQKEGYEYLADYAPLKEYVDRSKNPNFKVALAIEANDYNKQELVYALANSNFEELVTGNAMKMASCVDDKGNMSFGTVTEFINNATNAGMNVYGHTLAWHSQQPIKWLSSLIAGKEIEDDGSIKENVVLKMDFEDGTLLGGWGNGSTREIVAEGDNHVLKMTNSSVANFWEAQAAYDMTFEPGVVHVLRMKVKGTGNGILRIGFQNPSNYASAGDFPNVEVTTEWTDVEVSCTTKDDAKRFIMSYGDFVGSIYLDDITVSTKKSGAETIIEVDQLTNGSMEKGMPMDNFVVREPGAADKPGTPMAGGPDGKNCIKITSHANPTQPYDTQFFIYTPDKTWAGGEEYKISFWYKASEAAGSETQCHGKPGGYKYHQMLPTNPSFTTEWQYYEATSSIPASGDGMKSIAFNLNVNKNQVDYYFADIHWYTIEKGNKIPLTPEEKKDTLTWAMDNWITGMMQACEGYVTSWDVVNEALSGDDKDGDGWYDLQSATRNTVSEDDKANNFYWQDYLGDLDYVRTAVGLARKRFAENGGKGELKLFINDYNLESDWDDNKKLKSLIHWIQEWESDGVTKIDGIGSQMHVSCYADANIQKSKEEHVVKMLQLMKESGKLCKISELDMGFVDANDKPVKTEDLTEEQHKKMAAYYSFIVRKYFEIIPANQRYGITQWCITDAPESSGWRGGEPVGLWDSNYYRKHTYAGFADGLSGK